MTVQVDEEKSVHAEDSGEVVQHRPDMSANVNLHFVLWHSQHTTRHHQLQTALLAQASIVPYGVANK